MFDDFFNKAIHKAQQDWRDVVAEGARLGIPTPAFSTALSWFDGYRSERLPASMIQAQRDYFGAHTFRILPQYKSDKMPEGKDIHVNWVIPLLLGSLSLDFWRVFAWRGADFRPEGVEMFLRRHTRLKSTVERVSLVLRCRCYLSFL